MVKINYCPSCGDELIKGSFVCPLCNLDIEELFAKGYLLMSNHEDNSIELFEGNEEIITNDEFIEEDISNNSEANVDSGDEIVIVVPEGADNDELVIDFDKLGIDVENLDDNVNIVIEVEGFNFEDDYEMSPNEWHFDDDPYEIVYYEFVNMGD